MIGTNKEKAYQDAKKCLDQLLANDQIPFYGYVEIMLQLDTMMAVSRAKWTEYKQFNEIAYYCSNCKVTKSQAINKFCACCGAKMEGYKDE